MPCIGARMATRAGRQIGVGRPGARRRRGAGVDLPSVEDGERVGRVEAHAGAARGLGVGDVGAATGRGCLPGGASRSPTCSSTKRVVGRRVRKSRVLQHGPQEARCSSPRPRCGTRRVPPTARRAAAAQVRLGRGRDHLGQQRVEVRARGVAGVAERVRAQARADRRLERGEHAARRLRRPVGAHRLQVHPGLDGHATRRRHRSPACSRGRASVAPGRARAGAARGRRR